MEAKVEKTKGAAYPGRREVSSRSTAPTVSVIIPTFNRATTLPASIESVQRQTHPVGEIIVVDDGSEDGTSEVVEVFGDGVTYIHQRQQGVSAARNRGISQASGEWLAFLDSDDRWCTNKIQRQLAYVGGGARIVHSDEIWVRRGRRVNPMRKHAKKGGNIYRDCLPLCVISPSSVMIHRSLFDEVGLFDESLPVCEDYDLWLRICAREPVAYVPEPLIWKFGGHADQLSGRYWGLDRFRIRAMEKVLDSGRLSEEDRMATLEMLIHKAGIYLEGARKRGRAEDVEIYELKRSRACRALRDNASTGEWH